ncbi:MAG: hypothetical protein NTY03_05235, partial [Candidatus Bathyarchaeota archaeon]|nr:hypothetical protein [Candidatus Bathyarchaeota archaeon]
LRRAFALVAQYLLFPFYKNYAICYLYEVDITDILEGLKGKTVADFAPGLQNLICRAVFSNQDADAMEDAGLEFRSYNSSYRKWLEKGAVAYCIFIDKEFAHIVWAAMNEEAKQMIDPIPYKVNFANNEVCISEIWTNLKYRAKGLLLYSLFMGLQILKEMGKSKCRVCIPVNRTVTQKAATVFGSRVYAEGRYLRILWWKFWREKPRLG